MSPSFQGCVENKFTVYATESYAPGLQEALLWNPNCTYDFKPPPLTTPLKAAVNKVAGHPIPPGADVVAQVGAVERVASAAYVAGYGSLKAPVSLSNDNGKSVNATDQKKALEGMMVAQLG